MTFDDEISAALRRDLQAAHVGFDAAGAEDMIRVATQSEPLGEKRSYAAPLAAAAAVVVIGGGVATFAATRDGSTPTGGGPVAPAPCGSTSVAPAGSAPGSALPPVYTATAYPTPVTTAPDLPTAVSSSTLPSLPTAAPSTSPGLLLETPVPAPVTGAVTLTLPPTVAPSATAPAHPSRGTTDDPCAPSGTPSATASDLPTPVPTVAPSTPSCEPGTLDPGFCGQPVVCTSTACETTYTVSPIAVAGQSGSSTTTGPVSPTSALIVTAIRIRNSGDSGTIRISQGSTEILTDSLSNIRDLDFRLSADHALRLTPSSPITISIDCTNDVDVCNPTVQITGRPIGLASSTPAASAPHS